MASLAEPEPANRRGFDAGSGGYLAGECIAVGTRLQLRLQGRDFIQLFAQLPVGVFQHGLIAAALRHCVMPI